jgi:FAD:protein FMN transferase
MRSIGTTASVVVEDPKLADTALAILAVDLDDLDEACSRFRPDSELRLVERFGRGRATPVSPLLFSVLDASATIATLTGGIVDPTIGSALVELGYDRDFADIVDDQLGPVPAPRPAPGWWRVRLDLSARTATIPAGVHVDVGSAGKAYAADRSAHRIAEALDCGVLVNLGGDIAVAGAAPDEGWGVGIALSSHTAATEADDVVVLRSGGLASSGTTSRSWMRGATRVHHIVDPWTGEIAPSTWALASVLAPTCLEANGWSTASIVWGEDAPGNLAAHGLSARLVSGDGAVHLVGDWPWPATASAVVG